MPLACCVRVNAACHERLVCGTGTHDNETTVGWWNDSAQDAEKEYIKRYLHTNGKDIAGDFMRESFKSVSKTSIVMLQVTCATALSSCDGRLHAALCFCRSGVQPNLLLFLTWSVYLTCAFTCDPWHHRNISGNACIQVDLLSCKLSYVMQSASVMLMNMAASHACMHAARE